MRAGGRLTLLSVLAAVAGFAGQPARGDIIDNVTATVNPTTYEGPCPALIGLAGVVSFDVVSNEQEKYTYRWESGNQVLTDDVTAFSKGRRNHVLAMWEVQEVVGKTVTMPIVLHAWRYVAANYGKTTADRYSTPVNLIVTCQ